MFCNIYNNYISVMFYLLFSDDRCFVVVLATKDIHNYFFLVQKIYTTTFFWCKRYTLLLLFTAKDIHNYFFLVQN
ncbi:hypothetical protein [Arcobacter vandammei]|uniref:hypothetical protein n=1 Tax=Arcobacter vandammei TaxID=2782243 RepID=UPI00211D8571|nr:hypothetical protein [Arcobacter vandammei]